MNDKSRSLWETGVEVEGENSEDKITIWGYRRLPHQKVLYYVLSVLSFGFFPLVLFWKPFWKFVFLNGRAGLDQANRILVKDSYGQYFYEVVRSATHPKQHEETTQKQQHEEETTRQQQHEEETTRQQHEEEDVRYFINRKLKYLWDDHIHSFSLLKSVSEGTTCQSFHHASRGLSHDQQENRRHLYGNNETEIDIRPIWSLIWHEALNPYYIFQIYSFIVWSVNNYLSFALVTLALSAGAILLNVWQIRKQIIALRDMVYSRTDVTVLKPNHGQVTMTSDKLVPGDVIVMGRGGCVMECDAVILNGSCIVNESMLTGESVPLTKTPLPEDESDEILFHPDTHSRHVLYCGTQVIQTRSQTGEDVKAVVLRTGFYTKKGSIVRSIIFPKPINRRFYQDGMRLLICSLLIGMVGMIVTGSYMFAYDVKISEIILNTLDIMTFVVPPSLPALLTLCNVQAQKRLAQKKVFCLSCKFINTCGILNVVCFDKTGTLTNDGLDLWGLVPVRDGKFQAAVESADDLEDERFTQGMAACHSLTYINGQLSGYPIDLQLFQATKWTLEEDMSLNLPGDVVGNFNIVKSNEPEDEEQSRLVILKQFSFSSSLQRMTVIAAQIHGEKIEAFHVFVKGSPEKISTLCDSRSIPADFEATLTHYTKSGFRVLAMSHRRLPANTTWRELQKIPRDFLEKDLDYLGLVVMENALKPETRGALDVLHSANIRTVMVTGDNMLTATQIAFDCGMLRPVDEVIMVSLNEHGQVEYQTASKEENQRRPSRISLDKMMDMELLRQRRCFAMDGKVFEEIRNTEPELFSKLLLEGCVFARMLPEQKAQLIDGLQGLGYTVGMCGDGANDCGALRTADAGVSLSVAEASVASPFTGREPNISCVPTLIREGRCSLISSFGSFKMLLSVYYVIFIAALIMYSHNLEFGDYMFLYMDLACIISPIVFFGYVESYSGLVKRPPPSKMFSFSQAFSMVTFTLLQTGALILLLLYLQKQEWYEPHWAGADHPARHSHGTTVVYLTMCTMALCGNLIFSQGAPYRKAFYTNKPFTAIFIIVTLFNIYQTIYPANFITTMLDLKMPEAMLFRVVCLAYNFAANIICYIWETFVNQYFLWLIVIPWIEKKWQRGRPKYICLSENLSRDPSWPPGHVTGKPRLHQFTVITEQDETTPFDDDVTEATPFDGQHNTPGHNVKTPLTEAEVTSHNDTHV